MQQMNRKKATSDTSSLCPRQASSALRAAFAAHSFAISLANKNDQHYVRLYRESYALAQDVLTQRADSIASGAEYSGMERLADSLHSMEGAVGAFASPFLEDDLVLQRNAARHLRDDHFHTEIFNGEPTTPLQARECVALCRPNGNSFDFFGSGVLIGPRTILTAAHVLHQIGTTILVAFQNRLEGMSAAQLTRASGLLHPDYDPNSLQPPRHDIGLVFLPPPGVSIAPATPAPSNLINAAQAGTIVGYGATDENGTMGFGVRRFGHTALGSRTEFEINVGPAFSLNLPAGSCSGDSGGPLYVWNGSTPLLAGVASRGVDGNVPTCGYGSIYTRVDAYREFIAPHL